MSDLKRQKVGIWTRRRTTGALAVAFTAEECDKVLLTSMYLAIGNSLQALPSQLGQLTMWRALVQVRGLLCTAIIISLSHAFCTGVQGTSCMKPLLPCI